MTHLLVQSKNDSEHEGIPQTDSLRDSSVNHTLIAIAQEVAELLKQAYPVQTDNVRARRTQTTRQPLQLNRPYLSFRCSAVVGLRFNLHINYYLSQCSRGDFGNILLDHQ
jgi:hypothetical protein